MDVDSTTAMWYGEIVAALYKKRNPLPVNDIWIAAVTMQHNLVLVTRDKHFNEKEGLEIKNW